MDTKERADQLTALRDALLAIAEPEAAHRISACIDELIDFKIAMFENERTTPLE